MLRRCQHRLLADQVMRALNREGAADSSCLAAMGADISGFLESARNATKNVVIDGCKVSCGKRQDGYHWRPRRAGRGTNRAADHKIG